MGTVEIPGLDIWEKFEDLSLPPFSPDLSFEETSFDDIFNNSLCEKSVIDDGDEALKHIHEAIADLDCSLYNDQLEGESLDIAENLVFPNSLKSSFGYDDSVSFENVSTVIIDHPYARIDENKYNLKNSEDTLASVPMDKLFSGNAVGNKLKSRSRHKLRSNVMYKPSYNTKYVKHNKFDHKEREFHNSNERLRREDLKIKFELLRRKIPCLAENRKSTKFTILESASEYCEELFDKLRTLEEQKSREEKENKNLRKQLKNLMNCKDC